MTLPLHCPINGCLKTCKSRRGLTQHMVASHPSKPRTSSPRESSSQRWTHPLLTGEQDSSHLSLALTPNNQRAHVIGLVITCPHMQILLCLSPWTLRLKIHSVPLSIDLHLSFPSSIFVICNLRNRMLSALYGSGRPKQQNMVPMTLYLGNPLTKCIQL